VGAVIATGEAELTIEVNDSSFKSNYSQSESGTVIGSVMSIGAALVDIKFNNCTFDSNYSVSTNGGLVFGGVLGDGGADNTIEFTNCTFYNNYAQCTGNMCKAHGGAIGSGGASDISCNHCTFLSNPVSCTGDNCSAEGETIAPSVNNGITIANSIIKADNTANNCNGDGSVISLGYNIDNGSTCVDGSVMGDKPNTDPMLDPLGLQDNGGLTQTIALQPTSPALDSANPLNDLFTDQRGFPRPVNIINDIGAFEREILPMVYITKLTVPSGGVGFVFNSLGFDGLNNCDLEDPFVLDDMQTASCTADLGSYLISEQIPDGQVLTILCKELPEISDVDSLAGTLSFTIEDNSQIIDCLFVNSAANTLIRASEEPQGNNCVNGGIRLESGLDTNQNGVLDDEEVDDTEYVCNGAPGQDGGDGQDGDDGDTPIIDLDPIERSGQRMSQRRSEN